MSVHTDEASAGENCSYLGPTWIFLDEGSDGSVEVRLVNEAWMAAHSSSLSSIIPPSLPHILSGKKHPQGFLMLLVYPAILFLVSTSLCVKPSVALEQLAFLEIQYRRERLRNSDSPCCVCNTPVHVTRDHMIGRFNELYVTMPFA